MLDFENFLKENNIFDEDLVNELKDFHQKFLISKRYNGSFGSCILKIWKDFEYDKDLFSSVNEYVSYLIQGVELHECEICHNKIEFKRHLTRKYCHNCKTKYFEIHHDEIETKKKETCLRHFGVKSPIQSEMIRNRIKETCFQKYGTESCLSNSVVRKKIEETNLKKYGNVCCSKNEDVKEKIRTTCIDRYGVENTFLSDAIQEKCRTSLKNSYGVEIPMKSFELKEKRRQTMLEKYGREMNVSDESYEKTKKTNKKKYGFENFKRYDAWMNILKLKLYEPLFLKDEFIGNDNVYKWKCKICLSEFSARYDDGHVIGRMSTLF